MTDREEWLLRSLLFAPGDHPRRLERVGSFGADAVVLDLEDAVARAQKEAAREMVRASLPTYEDSTIVLVRINGPETELMEADIAAVVCADLDGIMVPKVEHPDVLRRIDELLLGLEVERGLDEGQVRLLATIETAKGLVHCEEIAIVGPRRLVTLVFGPGDFTADLGIDLTPDATELAYARSRVVVAARAADLRAAVDGAYLLDLHDLEGLVDDSRRSRKLGFQGRVVIHPSHIEPVQRAYSDLPEEEVQHARRIVEAFERSETAGSAAIQVDGRLVDYPIYRRARRKLELYEAARALLEKRQ